MQIRSIRLLPMILALFVLAHGVLANDDKLPFPESVMSTVTVIGEISQDNSWRTLGTGFLMINYGQAFNLLITNRHILQTKDTNGIICSRKEIKVKTNLKSGIAELFGKNPDSWAVFTIPLIKSDTILWSGHPNNNFDIAAVYFPQPTIKDIALMKMSKIEFIPKSLSKSFDEVRLADEILFFGFPLGLGSAKAPQPVVRNGIVAYLGDNKIIILDAQSFGGSSGSPVVATGTSMGDSPQNNERKLIGINRGHLTSSIELKNNSNMNDNIVLDSTYMENAGLSIVYSTDLIYEAIDHHNKRMSELYNNILDSLNNQTVNNHK